jgi:hypothetical protein
MIGFVLLVLLVLRLPGFPQAPAGHLKFFKYRVLALSGPDSAAAL